MNDDKQKNKLKVIIITMFVVLIGMTGWFLGRYNIEKDKKECEENLKIANANGTITNKKTCEGKYSGIGAVSYDYQAKENVNGEITLELADGEYTLLKDGEISGQGKYIITDGNIVVLKVGPKLAGTGANDATRITAFLSITDNCLTISGGYGTYFVDPNFTLIKTQ